MTQIMINRGNERTAEKNEAPGPGSYEPNTPFTNAMITGGLNKYNSPNKT